MRILFDHSAPAPLARYLTQHTIHKAKDRGWDRLDDGKLLAAAEEAGYNLLLTADKNIRYQQNLSGRKICVLVLGISAWPILRHHTEKVAAVIEAAVPGKCLEIRIPGSDAKKQ